MIVHISIDLIGFIFFQSGLLFPELGAEVPDRCFYRRGELRNIPGREHKADGLLGKENMIFVGYFNKFT